MKAVRNCIQTQKNYHGKEDFQTEFRRFSKENGVPVAEGYVWG